MPYEGALAIVSIFIIAPSIVFGFLLLSKRGRNQVELAKYRLGEAELALERERLRVEALREENRKLDRLIEHRMEAP
jgi:hypothetical protein